MAPSFYEKEQSRIRELIKRPLLELTLQHLPHLQSSKSSRQDVWEIIATKLNTYAYEQSLNPSEKVDEIPILSGIFVEEIYETLMDKFTKKLPYHHYNGGITVKAPPQRDWYSERTDRLLCELCLTSGYDIELMAKMGKEKLENDLRSATVDTEPSHEEESGGAGGGATSPSTSNALQREKEKQLEKKIALLEQKLEEKNSQLEKLTNENKRLLELNHDMLEMNR
ncbi:hypothetical protein CLIB1423_01S11694 [[Candida] railenensis]|uniref:Uncharacterized protein n=1 Tax=[Candida] railenensis TaxID=45579 RepID=A0A9P0QJY0_9ASCO|nr:hypothetical protein CLIB1423_01S11694 [[Candida] railenensis]